MTTQSKENMKSMYEERIKYKRYTAKNSKWIKLRGERLKKDNHKCVICKSKKNLRIHHLTYTRLYNEKIDDVITLCKRCDNWIHRVSPPVNQPLFAKFDSDFNCLQEDSQHN